MICLVVCFFNHVFHWMFLLANYYVLLLLALAFFLESLPAIFCQASSFRRRYFSRKPARLCLPGVAF